MAVSFLRFLKAVAESEVQNMAIMLHENLGEVTAHMDAKKARPHNQTIANLAPTPPPRKGNIRASKQAAAAIEN